MNPPPRDEATEGERVRPDGFYEYVPMISTPAVTPIVSNGMSAAERRAAFHERIIAKGKANEVTPPVMPDVSEDKGGGVWNCLFADEKQFPEKSVVNTFVNTIDRRVAATACEGKYRIKVKRGSMSGRRLLQKAPERY